MRAAAIHQRCWNHGAREAACRCPECGRSYCRECVTEHEARLLCAACIAALAGRRQARRARRRFVPGLLALAGIVLAWVLFYAAGEGLILVTGRLEQASWQTR